MKTQVDILPIVTGHFSILDGKCVLVQTWGTCNLTGIKTYWCRNVVFYCDNNTGTKVLRESRLKTLCLWTNVKL
jgi:hypothetical protein